MSPLLNGCPFSQAQLGGPRGHAFEARIYAERPIAGFLPGSGHLHHLRVPVNEGDTYALPDHGSDAPASEVVRVDSGVAEGDEVRVHVARPL